MTCTNCGHGTSTRHTAAPELPPPDISSQQPPPPSIPYEDSFTDMNQYSFETLLAMKRDVEARDLVQFRESLKHMSDSLKALQVLTFVRIYNGEEFSPHGHNPKFCIWFLHNVLGFPEMASVNERFPGLQKQVEGIHQAYQANRLVID